MNIDYLGALLQVNKDLTVNESTEEEKRLKVPQFEKLNKKDFKLIKESTFTGVQFKDRNVTYKIVSDNLKSEDLLERLKEIDESNLSDYINMNTRIYEQEVEEDATQASDLAPKIDYMNDEPKDKQAEEEPKPIKPEVGKSYDFDDGQFVVYSVDKNIVYLTDSTGEYYSMSEDDFSKEVKSISESEQEYKGYTYCADKDHYTVLDPDGNFVANVDSVEEAKEEINDRIENTKVEESTVGEYFGFISESGDLYKVDLSLDESVSDEEAYKEVTLKPSVFNGCFIDESVVMGIYEDTVIVSDEDDNLYTSPTSIYYDKINQLMLKLNTTEYSVQREIDREYNVTYNIYNEDGALELAVHLPLKEHPYTIAADTVEEFDTLEDAYNYLAKTYKIEEED